MSPTDGRTDRQTDKVNQVYPPPPTNFVGRGYKNKEQYLRSKDKAEKLYDVSRHI